MNVKQGRSILTIRTRELLKKTTETERQAGMKRAVKLIENEDPAGTYRVEIWVAGKPELIFHFDNLEEAEKRYEDEVALQGF